MFQNLEIKIVFWKIVFQKTSIKNTVIVMITGEKLSHFPNKRILNTLVVFNFHIDGAKRKIYFNF